MSVKGRRYRQGQHPSPNPLAKMAAFVNHRRVIARTERHPEPHVDTDVDEPEDIMIIEGACCEGSEAGLQTGESVLWVGSVFGECHPSVPAAVARLNRPIEKRAYARPGRGRVASDAGDFG